MNRRVQKIVRNVVVTAVILCGLTWVCSKFVHLGHVEYTDNAQIRRNMIPINSRVQGFIQRVCFDDFQFVHEGDTLVVIEPAEYELRVAQARAGYQNALMENTARQTAISTTANNLTVSDANIEELRIRLEQTRTDFGRYEQLYAQKAVTRQQYDKPRPTTRPHVPSTTCWCAASEARRWSRTNRRGVWSRTRPTSTWRGRPSIWPSSTSRTR